MIRKRILMKLRIPFFESTIYVTFLFPNKKVTKEVVIGKALMPRSRATNAPSPMYLSRTR